MEPAGLIATDLACRRGERLLFRGLSLRLGAGEAVQVVGPNGTGKSSLIRILAGLLRPYAGTVERSVDVALLDERLALDGHLPLGQALRFWERVDGLRFRSPQAGRDLSPASLGLDGLLDVPIRYLSTGQRKRAAILLSNARVAGLWLLDEPLNGLDAEAAAALQRQVTAYLARGGSAVIASHQPFSAPGLQRLALADYAA
ncbi:MAG TPA: heme ABC exporter ATP-binding protein CcmA [Croceibacterium sp.]|nr:heme ABC exporter ATP-binding protein CcmA [Croceibacterium sp.]